MRRLSSCLLSSATLLLFSLTLLPPPARAETALAGKAGSLGAGAELTRSLSPHWNARLGVNGFDYSDRREASDIEYDAEAELRTASALVDWFPGGRGFRLSGGVVWNGNRATGRSIPPASGFYDVGGVPVPVSLVGRLDAEVEFDPVAPYLGLGFGNPVGAGRRWNVYLDLGAMFQGEGDVRLRPVFPPGSPIPGTPGALEVLDLLLRREEREIEDDIADYDVYPVLAVGVAYRFP